MQLCQGIIRDAIRKRRTFTETNGDMAWKSIEDADKKGPVCNILAGIGPAQLRVIGEVDNDSGN